MSLHQWCRRAAILACATAFAASLASPASAADVVPATSGTSSTSFSNGAKLTANIWIATWASGGCADFSSSAVISGGHAPVAGNDWVRNNTTLDPWGIDASVSAFGKSGDPISATWTNDNGSRGSYYSGNLCTNWHTVGVDGTESATAFYNGQTKSATAST